MGSDLYKILDVDKKANKKSIKSAYRKAAKKNHPDIGGKPEKFALIKKAHDILSHRISSLHIDIANFENTIKTHEESLEMIKDFSYKSDDKPYESPGDRMMRNMAFGFNSGWA